MSKIYVANKKKLLGQGIDWIHIRTHRMALARTVNLTFTCRSSISGLIYKSNIKCLCWRKGWKYRRKKKSHSFIFKLSSSEIRNLSNEQERRECWFVLLGSEKLKDESFIEQIVSEIFAQWKSWIIERIWFCAKYSTWSIRFTSTSLHSTIRLLYSPENLAFFFVEQIYIIIWNVESVHVTFTLD